MSEISVRSGSDLGRAIAELRIRRGLTQSELAELAGLSSAYVSKIETGRTSAIVEHELRILRRLGARLTIEAPDGSA